MQKIEIDWVHEADVAHLVRAERNSHKVKFRIPDAPLLGECEALQPWAMTEQDIKTWISEYRNKKLGTYETRCKVARLETPQMDPRTGVIHPKSTTVGGIIYRILENAYEILLLTVDPELVPDKRHGETASQSDVMDIMIEHVLRKSEESETRTKVIMHVPDGAWTLLKFFMDKGWSHRRVDRYFTDGDDAWLVEHESSVEQEEQEEETKNA